MQFGSPSVFFWPQIKNILSDVRQKIIHPWQWGRPSYRVNFFCYKNVTTHLESPTRFPPSVHIIPYPVVDIPEAGEGHDDGLVDEVDGLVDEAGQGRGRDSWLEAPGGRALSGGRVLRGPVTAVDVLQVLALLVIELNRKISSFFKNCVTKHQKIEIDLKRKYHLAYDLNVCWLTDLYSPAELQEFLAGAPYPSLGAP